MRIATIFSRLKYAIIKRRVSLIQLDHSMEEKNGNKGNYTIYIWKRIISDNFEVFTSLNETESI